MKNVPPPAHSALYGETSQLGFILAISPLIIFILMNIIIEYVFASLFHTRHYIVIISSMFLCNIVLAYMTYRVFKSHSGDIAPGSTITIPLLLTESQLLSMQHTSAFMFSMLISIMLVVNLNVSNPVIYIIAGIIMTLIVLILFIERDNIPYVSGWVTYTITTIHIIVTTILSYTVLYNEVGLYINGKLVHHALETSLYFSVVTFTTLGFGDIQPIESLRIYAASEAILGYIFMSLLVSIFFILIQRSLKGLRDEKLSSIETCKDKQDQA